MPTEIELFIEYQRTEKLYSVIDANIISTAQKAIIESVFFTSINKNFTGFKAQVKSYQAQDIIGILKTLKYSDRKKLLDTIVNPYIKKIHGDHYQVKFDSFGFMVVCVHTEIAFNKYLSFKYNQGKPYT